MLVSRIYKPHTKLTETNMFSVLYNMHMRPDLSVSAAANGWVVANKPEGGQSFYIWGDATVDSVIADFIAFEAGWGGKPWDLAGKQP